MAIAKQPSVVTMPPAEKPYPSLVEFLCRTFPAVSRSRWTERIRAGKVLDDQGKPVTAETMYSPSRRIFYFREIENEPVIPFAEQILFLDDEILVADKPHFLPVTPSGAHVHETLLGRLIRRTGNVALAPLHRIDRDTAGLVLFSANPQSRAHYQALFRERRIEKSYEAIAPALPDIEFPCIRSSRMVAGEPFFRMREIEGPANSETRIDVLARGEGTWRYALTPITGRKHQLRVHMAALGAPIANDGIYPSVFHREPGDYSAPLQLLANRLSFVDPLSGVGRSFSSNFALRD